MGTHRWRPRGTTRPGAVVVGVVGARGGVGSSTFAAVLAQGASQHTATVLVDLVGGAGVDVLLGLERVPGPRWPDVLGAGDLAGADLVASLPRWGRCAVLSGDRRRPGTDRPVEVLDRVAEPAGLVVVDLALADVLAGRAPVSRLDLVAVVVGQDVVSVAGALSVRQALGPVANRAGLAVGPRGGLSVTEVSHAAGLPVLCTLPRDRSLAASAGRGALVPGRRSARAAVPVIGWVLGAAA
jgi:hypothetical protein